MLFYIRCPTCSEILTYNFKEYNDELDAILNDPNLKGYEKELARAKLLDKYGIVNSCCRIRIIGYLPFHKIII